MSGTPEVLTIGESMVAFRSDGPVVQVGTQTSRVAGAESNVATGLARLGHSVSWAGRFPYQLAHLPFNRLKDGTVHDW
jgi:2-dehydro-3-deoxygluconokinase